MAAHHMIDPKVEVTGRTGNYPQKCTVEMNVTDNGDIRFFINDEANLAFWLELIVNKEDLIKDLLKLLNKEDLLKLLNGYLS